MKKAFDQTFRDIKRGVNKKVLKVPSIEQKVLDATSNEPWGPHGTHLAYIAQASRNYHEYQMIMSVVWKRISDTGKNWRHVYKALTVLEYLVANGSERVIDDIREHVYQISALSAFQYIDSTGRDQGSNIRKKSQSLVALVNDKEKVQEAREKAATNRDKFRNAPGDDRNEGRYGSRDEDRNGYGREREWGDEKYGGRSGEDQYGRDDEYRGRSPSVDGDYGPRSRSSDRDDGHHSSRGSNGKVEDGSQDGSRLEPNLSGQTPGAPPSYEDAVGDSRSPVHSNRDGEIATTFASKPPSPPPAAAAALPPPAAVASPAAALPPTAPATAPTPAVISNNDNEGFDLFDPRASFPAAPPASGGAEMDLLGSLSDSFSSNALALVPSTSEAQTFVAASPASGVSSQPFDDPFGDGPFRAVPSTDGFLAQPPSTPFDSIDEPSLTENNLGFGDTFDQTTDILADILPPPTSAFQAQAPHLPTQTSFPSETGFEGPFGPTPLPGFQTQTGQPVPHPGFQTHGGQPMPQPGFQTQSSQPMPQPDFQSQGSQPMPQPGLQSQGSQPMPQPGLQSQGSQPMPQPGLQSQGSQPMPQPGLQSQGSQPMPQPGFQSQGGQPMPRPGFQTQDGQPMPQPGFQSQGSQPMPQPGFQSHGSQPMMQPGFQSQGSQPMPQPGFQSQGSQPMPQPGFQTQGGQPMPQPGFQTQGGQPKPQQGFQSQGGPFGPISQPGFQTQNGQPMLQPGFQSQSGQPMPQPGFQSQSGQPMPQPGFQSQSGQPMPQPGFQSQSGQPMPQPGFQGQSGQPMPQPGFPPQGGPQQGFQSQGGQVMQQHGFQSQGGQPMPQPAFPPQGGQQPAFRIQGGHQSMPQPSFAAQGSQSLSQLGLVAPQGGQNPPLGGFSSQSGFPSSNGQHAQSDNFYGGQPPTAPQYNTSGYYQQPQPQSTLTASTGALAIVPQQPAKEKFETKSTVWADTLNRGLVNLNISGSKTNPLSDIGIDFEAINRKEKRMEKPSRTTTTTPVTSNVTMGKAMGSGSGMGRAGAGVLRPAPNPMVGSGMGAIPGYGGVNQQPMGLNHGQGFQMQQPPANYYPMMGRGVGYGQQPYGGYR